MGVGNTNEHLAEVVVRCSVGSTLAQWPKLGKIGIPNISESNCAQEETDAGTLGVPAHECFSSNERGVVALCAPVWLRTTSAAARLTQGSAQTRGTVNTRSASKDEPSIVSPGSGELFTA